MEHVVFFSETSGESEFRRVGDLEEAVRLVETLRNDRSIADVTLHALTPIPVSFRTYYRVEVGEVASAGRPGDLPAGDPAAGDPAAVDPAAVDLPAHDDGGDVGALEPVVAAEWEDAPVEPASVDVLPVALAPVEFSAVPSLGLLAPPVVEPVELDVAGVPEADVDGEVFEFGASAEAGDPSERDQLDGLMSYEPLVPSVRPESDTERTSLGYFAS